MYNPKLIADLKAMVADVETTKLLNALEDEAKTWGEHSDWPWNGFVLSGATRDGSARWDKNIKPHYEDKFSWKVLSGLSDDEVKKRLNQVGRFKTITGAWLWKVFEEIRKKGGPSGIRTHLAPMSAPGVICFLQCFLGCGPKYARNIMMDVHDPRFHNKYFAIDSRIKKLLFNRLGYTGKKNDYAAQEDFLVGLAAEVGISCWELDRLLYNKAKDV